MIIDRLIMNNMRSVMEDSFVFSLFNKIQQDIRIYVFVLVLDPKMQMFLSEVYRYPKSAIYYCCHTTNYVEYLID